MKKDQLELRVFSSAYVDKLYRNVIATQNFEEYLQPKFPYEDRYPKGATGIIINKHLILDPDKEDIENCKAIYDGLDINETQASDERFWVYLTHVYFFDYMKKRWPIKDASKPISRIKDRYFLRTISIETLTRNGISRLWWYAHLTYDKSRRNPYELTEVLLSRADLTVGLTERAFGSNKNIRIALLEFLMGNPSIATNEDRTRELYKGLNLVGGVKNLPFLEVSELKDVLGLIPL